MTQALRKDRQLWRAILLLLIFLTTMLLPNRALVNTPPASAGALADVPADKGRKNDQTRILETYGSLPLSFEQNQGQSAAQVKFLARGSAYNIFLTEDETVIKLPLSENSAPAGTMKAEEVSRENRLQEDLPVAAAQRETKKLSVSSAAVLRIKLVGSQRPAQIRGVDQQAFKSNYFIGRESANWRTEIPNFAKVHYERVYDGVDMIFYGAQRQLEYDFQIAAGANPQKITMAFAGAQRLRLDAKGDLILSVGGKEIRQRKPVAFQEMNGRKQTVAVRYMRKGKTHIGFQLGRYDKSKPLVIDPVLVYSTYLGGLGSETAAAIDVDASGSAYVTGTTNSFDFPLVNPIPPGPVNQRGIFIAKFNPTGTALAYSSVVRTGFSSDTVSDIKVDSSGHAYVTGETSSPTFPIVNAFQPVLAGAIDAFLMKLSPGGSSLLYSTYLGGSDSDRANSLAIDGGDNAIIAGVTNSPNFPVANALQPAINGFNNAFVTKFNPAGSAFVYSTYLGGSNSDTALGIAADGAGNVYVTGQTRSGDFPLVNPVQSAIADQTLLKSTNGGASWAESANGLPVLASVYDIEADPTQPSTLYLGANEHGVYKSTNGGANWSPANLPLDRFSVVQDVELAPTAPSTVYAGIAFNSLAKSTDGGATWTISKGGGNFDALANSIAVSRTSANHVYLASIFGGAFETTDGGMTFNELPIPAGGVVGRCLAIGASAPDLLYVGTDVHGIWKFTNRTWSRAQTDAFFTRSITVDPSNANTLYVVSINGLTKSTDGGMTSINLNLPFAEALAIDPGNSSVVYAGTRTGLLYKSTNGGLAWTQLLDKPTGGGFRKLEIDPSSPNTIYAGALAGGDAYVSKINPSGSALLFSTYFGGRGNDSGTDIALDSSGNPIITGGTGSADLPTTSLQRTNAGSTDAFVTKFDIANHQIAYSTYVGGSGNEAVNDIAVDGSGNAYITGSTVSTNFPTTRDAIPLSNNGLCITPVCTHAFLTKLNASGSGFAYSTYLGGTGVDVSNGVAVDSANNAYLAGSTTSVDFPTTPQAFDRELARAGIADAFILKIVEGSPLITCLKDDANGNILRVNTSVGEFEFVNCRKGWSVKGQLTATTNGCKTTLTSDTRGSVRINGLVNTCIRQGSATVIVDGKSYTIADPVINGDECSCSTR
jgi:hypothetical protein